MRAGWWLGLAGVTGVLAAVMFHTPAYAASGIPAPKEDLKAGSGPATVVLAGGCFWCVEAVFEELDGVTAVVSGYAGGSKLTAVYGVVSSGATDHAEVVQVTYDPQRISLGTVLQVFFSTHDPTTLNRQGPDAGRQYRSAVFYADEAQRKVAEAYIKQLSDAGAFKSPIVTTLEKLDAFYPAEAYHQDFVKLHPEHPYVQAWSVPKVKKTRELFSARLKFK